MNIMMFNGLLLIMIIMWTSAEKELKADRTEVLQDQLYKTVSHLDTQARAKDCRNLDGKCIKKTRECPKNRPLKTSPGSPYCSKNRHCCYPDPDCVFGGQTYKNGAYIEDTCLVLQCISGNWIYTNYTNSDCGSCEVFGDPHFTVFEYHTMPQSNYAPLPNSSYYNFQGNGSYVISQHGLSYPSSFGINSTFENCGYEASCVSSIRYYEPGIDIDIILPSPTKDCNNYDSCTIKVYVNGIEQIIGKSVESFIGTEGTILVFNHNHLNLFDIVSCINIVGSKGLSVSLCSVNWKYSFLNVWAAPSLKTKENQLFGLCDVFTGKPQNGYKMQNGSITNIINDFARSWKGEGSITPITELYKVGRCNGTSNTVVDDIQQQCIFIFWSVSIDDNTISESELGEFVLSCMYDLCRLPYGPDTLLYQQGYAIDLATRRHFKGTPCSPFPSCCTILPYPCK